MRSPGGSPHWPNACPRLEEELEQGAAFLPRIFLIESELLRDLVTAELSYVRALIEDLKAKRVTWPSPREPEPDRHSGQAISGRTADFAPPGYTRRTHQSSSTGSWVLDQPSCTNAPSSDGPSWSSHHGSGSIPFRRKARR